MPPGFAEAAALFPRCNYDKNNKAVEAEQTACREAAHGLATFRTDMGMKSVTRTLAQSHSNAHITQST